jgi:hypothetical protein
MFYAVEVTRESRDVVDFVIGCHRTVQRRYVPHAPYMIVYIPDEDLVRYIKCMSGAYMIPVGSSTMVH